MTQDVRDGEPVIIKNLPRGTQAFRLDDGQIALWDGERHVVIGPNREGLKFALANLKAARG